MPRTKKIEPVPVITEDFLPEEEEPEEIREPIFKGNTPAVIHYAFAPEIRPYDESIQRELTSHIERISAAYAIPHKELSAIISLNYLPNGTWALLGEVIHQPSDDKEESS